MKVRSILGGFSILVAAWGLVWLITSASNALAHTNCEIYARYTALQLRTNVDDRCNFTGTLWEGSVKEHIAWCQDVPFDEVRRVLSERKELLEQCRKSPIRN